MVAETKFEKGQIEVTSVFPRNLQQIGIQKVNKKLKLQLTQYLLGQAASYHQPLSIGICVFAIHLMLVSTTHGTHIH